MRLKAIGLAATASLLMTLTACNPASPQGDPIPDPIVPPTTSATAAVETMADLQSTNPSLSPEGQPLEKPISCREERGDPAAKRLVERCIMVSPATRPPCNVQNTCALIQDEIDRGCGFFPADEKPAECTA